MSDVVSAASGTASSDAPPTSDDIRQQHQHAAAGGSAAHAAQVSSPNHVPNLATPTAAALQSQTANDTQQVDGDAVAAKPLASAAASARQKAAQDEWGKVLRLLEKQEYKVKLLKEQQYAHRALFCLQPGNRLRRAFISFIEWEWFNRAVVILILANCVFLALSDPVCEAFENTDALPSRYTTPSISKSCDYYDSLQLTLTIAEFIFAGLFTVEMLCKIIAKGFILHKHSYLRDPWNWMDFAVVILSWMGLSPNFANFSALRTVRVLRPLRTMSRIKGMRPLVSALLRSLRPLSNVVLLCFFVFFIFGILGLDVFVGTLRNYCFYSMDNADTSLRGTRVMDSNGDPQLCSQLSGGHKCGIGQECLGKNPLTGAINTNPGSGFISFDNIGMSFLTIFQAISMEGWVDIMYNYEDAVDVWGARVFFILLVLFGSFFVINLALAVISDSFFLSSEEEKHKLQNEAVKRRAEHARVKAERRANKGGEDDSIEAASTAVIYVRSKLMSLNHSVQSARRWFNAVPAISFLRSACKKVVESSNFQVFIILMILANTVSLALEYYSQDIFEDKVCAKRSSGACTGPLFNRTTFVVSSNSTSSLFSGNLLGCVNVQTGAACYPSVSNWTQLSIQSDSICDSRSEKCIGMPDSFQTGLENVNLALTVIFIAEMLLKLLGLGISGYVMDTFNIFDGFIVLMSVVELATFSSGGGSSISVLRAFRLFRVFKLARSWVSLRKILETIGRSITSLGPLAIVLGIFMYIVSLLGMQLFGAKFEDDGEIPRSNFDSFLPSSTGFGAMVTVFQIISGENWNEVMYDGMDAIGPAAAMYFVVLVILGSYLIMNLFLAILLQGFSEDDDEEDESSAKNAKKLASVIGTLKKLLNKIRSRRSAEQATAATLPSHMLEDPTVVTTASVSGPIHSGKIAPLPEDVNGSSGVISSGLPSNQGSVAGDAKIAASNSTPAGSKSASASDPVPNGAAGDEAWQSALEQLTKGKYMRKDTFSDRIRAMFVQRNSLGFLGPDPGGFKPLYPFRAMVERVVDHNYFESLIMFCIFCSSLVLILEHPADEFRCDKAKAEGGDTSVCRRLEVFFVMNVVFVSIFTLEMVFRIISSGFVMHPKSYLQDPWNVLDCFIVIVSIISLSATSTFKSLRALRTFRTLRPLRVIQRNPGMKISVVCLLRSIPSMMNVGVVCLLFFAIFGILGIQLFKGAFYSCQTAAIPSETIDVDDMLACAAAGGIWQQPFYGFDSFGGALLTLFEMSTTEGWVDMMSSGVDAVGPGIQPSLNHSPTATAFFILFLVVGSFFVLNLFVGVVIDNYNRIKNENAGDLFLTKPQREWIAAQKIIMKSAPEKTVVRPSSRVRFKIHEFVEKPEFDVAVMILIALNIICMSFKHYQQPNALDIFLNVSNIVFSSLFLSEAILKMVGYGFKTYFANSWNVFDFIVVILSIGSVATEQAIQNTDSSEVDVPAVSVLRAARIARIFRLVKGVKGLRQLFETLLFSLPSLVNLGSLLLIIFVIYATLGVAFFHNVRMAQDGNNWINEHANFMTFGTAMVTLFRSVTGESWNGIMHYTMQEDPKLGCQDYEQLGDGCGSPATGVLFFVTFTLLCTFITLNLFIAIILDNFNTAVENSEAVLPREKLHAFPEVWERFDPEANGIIPSVQLPELLMDLDPPLGVRGKPVTRGNLLQIIKDLDLPIRPDGMVHYVETLHALAFRIAGTNVPSDSFQSGYWSTLQDRITETYGPEVKVHRPAVEGGRPPGDIMSSNSVASEFAARSVQLAFREWREKKLQVAKGQNRVTRIALSAPGAVVFPKIEKATEVGLA